MSSDLQLGDAMSDSLCRDEGSDHIFSSRLEAIPIIIRQDSLTNNKYQKGSKRLLLGSGDVQM